MSDGKRLTKRKALELSAELWGWLAENPDKGKHEWPRWQSNGGDVAWCIYGCPCCEYVLQKTMCAPFWRGGDDGRYDSCADYCPLTSLWPAGCEGALLPYTKWRLGETPAECRKYAKIIRDGALAELAKLPPLKGRRKRNGGA